MKPPRWARRGANDFVDVVWTLGQFCLVVWELIDEARLHVRGEWRARRSR